MGIPSNRNTIYWKDHLIVPLEPNTNCLLSCVFIYCCDHVICIFPASLIRANSGQDDDHDNASALSGILHYSSFIRTLRQFKCF